MDNNFSVFNVFYSADSCPEEDEMNEAYWKIYDNIVDLIYNSGYESVDIRTDQGCYRIMKNGTIEPCRTPVIHFVVRGVDPEVVESIVEDLIENNSYFNGYEPCELENDAIIDKKVLDDYSYIRDEYIVTCENQFKSISKCSYERVVGLVYPH